jgi:glutaminase
MCIARPIGLESVVSERLVSNRSERDRVLRYAAEARGFITKLRKFHCATYADVNEEVTSVMMTCGMYNGAGNWMVDVGIPAKSGVGGGGIFGVVPGVCGIAVFSPRLNPTWRSRTGEGSSGGRKRGVV